MTFADWTTVGLIVFYIAIGVSYVVEKNWPKVIYFFGGAILTFGVLLMK
jgi:drug/metabolite transporter (DMT)-like permease